MDTLLAGGCAESVNISKFKCELLPSFLPHQVSDHMIGNRQFVDQDHGIDSKILGTHIPPAPYSRVSPNEMPDHLSDFPDDCLKFISEILMEEDLDDQTASLYDYTALQATEKSLYDALAEECPSSSDEYHPPFLSQSVDSTDEICHQIYSSQSSSCGHGIGESNTEEKESKGRKNLTRKDIDYEEERKSKHLASHTEEEYLEMAQYDDVLLCKEDGCCKLNGNCRSESSDDGESGKSKVSNKKKKTRGKKKGDEGEGADLTTLLTQCAQAVAIFDLRNANEVLKKIRLYSSPYGNSTQRVSHYLANALEARLAGTGWQQCRDFGSQRIPFSMVLKAYREQVTAIPFRRASYFVANDAIAKLAEKATKIHIIDFGIFFGFQWPGLIQNLSRRTTGPPMLRITGIDYPETGFRPAQRVEETGHRLAEYCKRFNVPFQYQSIAKSWESIRPEELNIDSEELVVVNCLYMSRKLVDETVEENNPRDTFLRLIRKLNPDLFIHGIVNGSYNAPFFVTRFKEALFHYSSVFDMFEATIPRESDERLLVENHLFGKDAFNVIACEGIERIERPETYRQWQVRVHRAGFRKLPLEYQVVKRVKDHVKQNHHKDFLVDQDAYFMLQGWKGRILYALSCWKLN